MSDDRLPKIILSGELKNKRPAYGPKKRWRDLISGDLQQLGMVNSWYQLCQDRGEWYKQCQKGVNQIASCRENPCVASIHSGERTFVC